MVILAIRGSCAKNISMTTAIRDAKGKSGLASSNICKQAKEKPQSAHYRKTKVSARSQKAFLNWLPLQHTINLIIYN